MSFASALSLFVSKYLFVLAALLPIMNPPGMVPIFISMTDRNSTEQRGYLAFRVAIGCFFLILLSMYVGGYALSFFGVSLPVVQLSGGLLITYSAWRMLNDTPAETTPTHADHHEHISKEQLNQKAFFPLTFPLSVGPGTISVSITIGASLNSRVLGIGKLVVVPLASVAAVLTTSIIVFVCYRYADKLLKYLGQTGTIVFMRLSAFILLCLGVQIMWSGFSDLWVELLKEVI